MKTTKLKIEPECDFAAEIMPALKSVQESPRHEMGLKFLPRLGRRVGPLLFWDWRDVAARYLRRALPDGLMVYKGGSHIAIHDGKICIARILECK